MSTEEELIFSKGASLSLCSPKSKLSTLHRGLSTQRSNHGPGSVYQQAQSPIFRLLPAEVHAAIYVHYLVFTCDCFVDKQALRVVLDRERAFSHPLPPLMTSCRRLYHELAPLALGRAALRLFRLERTSCVLYGVAVYGLLRWEALRTLTLVVSLAWPWETWADEFRVVVAMTPGLKELVVEWFASQANTVVKSTVVVNIPPRETRPWVTQEEAFLDAIGTLKELEVINFRGDVPDKWIDVLGKETQATIVKWKLVKSWDLP